MNFHIFRIWLVCTFLLMLSACTKEKDPTTAPAQTMPQVVLEGAITLPSGTSRDVNALQVASPIAVSNVQNGHYKISTYQDEFTLQLASDASGQPVLIGYNYPGQTNFDINSQSTALALLMSCEAVHSISPAGKLALITKVRADPAFTALTQEVERALRTGRPLLDSTNAALPTSIAALFTRVARRTTTTTSPAVLVNQGGNAVSFTNAGVAFTNAVGVYRNGTSAAVFMLPGQDFVPTSLLNIVTNVVLRPSPTAITYPFPADGTYNIKIRSGKSTTAGGNGERNAALTANLAQACAQAIGALIPQFSQRLQNKTKCSAAYVTSFIEICNSYMSLMNITNYTFSSGEDVYPVVGKILIAMGKGGYATFKACEEPTPPPFFLLGLNPLIKIARLTANIAGNTANLTFLALQWMYYPAAQDTCFQVIGGKVVACGAQSLKVISGNNQTGPFGKALPLPIKIQVIDASNNPIAGAKVAFDQVNAWSGSATPQLTITDANGYAQAIWTLGNIYSGPETMRVTAKGANSLPIPGATVDFLAEPYSIFSYGFNMLSGGGAGTLQMILRDASNSVAFDTTCTFTSSSVIKFNKTLRSLAYTGTFHWTNSSLPTNDYWIAIAGSWDTAITGQSDPSIFTHINGPVNSSSWLLARTFSPSTTASGAIYFKF